VDLTFVCAQVDWVVDTPQPVKRIESVRETDDDDATWERKKRNHAPVEMAYTLDNQKWLNANKKCMAFINNANENAIAGSIKERISVGEFLVADKAHRSEQLDKARDHVLAGGDNRSRPDEDSSQHHCWPHGGRQLSWCYHGRCHRMAN
jgi:hypothetical protein